MIDSLLDIARFCNSENKNVPVYFRDGMAFFYDADKQISVVARTFMQGMAKMTLGQLFGFKNLSDFEFSLEFKKAASMDANLHSPKFITPLGTFKMPDAYMEDIGKILRCSGDKVIFNNWLTACSDGQSFALIKMPFKWPISFLIPTEFIRRVALIDDKLINIDLNNERIQFNFANICVSAPIVQDNSKRFNFGFLNHEFKPFEMRLNLQDIAMINQVNEDGLLEMDGDYYSVGTSKHKVQKSTVNCKLTVDSMRNVLNFTGDLYTKSESDLILRFESYTIIAGAAKCI